MTRVLDNTNGQQSTQNTTNNTQESQFTQQQNNPLGNLLGNIFGNSNTITQMTAMILGGDQGTTERTSNGSQSGQTGGLNLNSLIQGILNPSRSTSTTSNIPNINSNNMNESTSQSTQNNNPYPILNAPNEQIFHLERIVDRLSGLPADTTNSAIPKQQNLNYPLNVLTATGQTLRNYYSSLVRFSPFILKLADCLERESLISDENERQKVKILIQNISGGFEALNKATIPFQSLLRGLNYGNSPGTGFLSLATGTVRMVGGNN